MIRRVLIALAVSLVFVTPAFASTLFPSGGGTGSTTLSGILIGNGAAAVQTLTIGTNLTLVGTTLSASSGGSSFAYPFPSNATSTSIAFNGGLTASTLSIGTLTGMLKASSGAVSTASNGTDFTLITAKTCPGSDFISAVTAAGVFTCTTPSSGGSSFAYLFPSNATSTSIAFNGGLTGVLTGSLVGNSSTATALAAGRTLAITGDLTWTSPSFDGSGNVMAAGTLATVNSNVGSFTNANITVNGKGLITAASNGTASGSAFPFTSTTNFGALTNATGTPVWFQAGLQSSSTIQAGNFAGGNNLNWDGGGLNIGAYSSLASTSLRISTTTNNFIQGLIQNLSTGTNASANWIVSNNKDTSGQTYYSEFGINGSGYSQAAQSAENGGDSYLTASDGALVIGTASSTNALAQLRFTTGGLASSSIRMLIDSNGNVGIATTTPGTTLSVNGDAVLAGKTTARIFTATSTLAASTFPYASTTMLSASGSASTTALVVSGVRSALHLASADGTVSAYGGSANCTNQVINGISALGAGNCVSVSDAMLSSTFVKTLTVTTAAGISGSFSAGATPALSLTLGALTGVTSLNGLIVTANTGVITTGTWNGTTIAIANGGTNATSFTTSGNTVYWDGTRLATSLTTGSATTPYASSTVLSATGPIYSQDTQNAWTGKLSPTHPILLQTGTTTAWTATTSGAYIPTVVAPYAGTLKQARCYTDASFVGVQIQINGTDIAPKYFIASSTVGLITATGSNTFVAGDRITAKFGTTTTASTLTATCTIDTTQT